MEVGSDLQGNPGNSGRGSGSETEIETLYSEP